MKSLEKNEIEGAYKDAISNILSKNKVGGRLVENGLIGIRLQVLSI